MGRYQLSELLDLSLAKTRALLQLLTKKNITQTSGQSSGRKGTQLTSLGNKICNKILEFATIDFELPHYIGESLQIKKMDRRVGFIRIDQIDTTGIYERDIAIRNGAEAAISLLYDKQKWIFPDGFVAGDEFKPLNHNKYNFASIVSGTNLGSIYNALVNIISFHLMDKLSKILSELLEQ